MIKYLLATRTSSAAFSSALNCGERNFADSSTAELRPVRSTPAAAAAEASPPLDRSDAHALTLSLAASLSDLEVRPGIREGF